MSDRWESIVIGSLIGLELMALVFAFKVEAVELPFETYEWTDGHGRVCTVIVQSERGEEEHCSGSSNCSYVETFTYGSPDCDWPQREDWQMNYPISPTGIMSTEILKAMSIEEFECLGVWDEAFEVCIDSALDTIVDDSFRPIN